MGAGVAPPAIVRQAFARQLAVRAGAEPGGRLERAFAAVSRERFLGAPPWQIAQPGAAPLTLPDNDPVHAYQNVLFVLDAAQGVNNGEPLLHARLLNALAPVEGARTLHLGCGTGYYTAVLAELVGPDGRVDAVEVEPALAKLAAANLADRPNVAVRVGDAALLPEREVDLIYVNFCVAVPATAWLDRLSAGGRLLVPWGVPYPRPLPGPRYAERGAAFLIAREADRLAASAVSPAYFIMARGGGIVGDAEGEASLRAAFARGDIGRVQRLYWREAPSAPVWASGLGWALAEG